MVKKFDFWGEFDKQIEIIAVQMDISKEEARLKLLEAMQEKLDEENNKEL